MKVSVVIPSYNSAKTIRRCIDSLLRQDINERFEIIIVDSSKDGTERMVKKLYKNVKVIHLDEQTYPGKARNIGVKNASGGCVAFIDSDCVADKSWLRRLTESLKVYNAVGGSVGNYNKRSLVSWADFFLAFSEFMQGMPKKETDFVPTCNVGYKKAVFEKTRFPEDIIAGEDLLFNWAVAKQERMLFNPDIKIWHKNRETLQAFIKHNYNLGLHSALARRITGRNRRLIFRMPLLSVMLAVTRTCKAFTRVARWNRRFMPIFIAVFPLYFIGALFWGYAFSKNIRH